jgi:hypothetical protein
VDAALAELQRRVEEVEERQGERSHPIKRFRASRPDET